MIGDGPGAAGGGGARRAWTSATSSTAARSARIRSAPGLAAIDGDAVLVHDAARPFCPPAVDRPAARAARILRRRGAGAAGRRHARPRRRRARRAGRPRRPGPRPDAAGVPARRAARRPTPRWTGAAPTDETTVVRAAGMQVAAVEGDPALDKLTTAADFAPRRAMARRTARPAHRHGLRRPRLRRRRPGHARRHRRAARRAALPGTATPTSCSTRSPTPCSAPPASATSASISRRPTRAGRARRRTASWPMRSSCSATRGAIIDHVDCTIIAEEPKVGPYRAAMRERIAEIAGLERRPGQHQGDDDRRPRLHRPARRHCRAGGRQHPHGTSTQ